VRRHNRALIAAIPLLPRQARRLPGPVRSLVQRNPQWEVSDNYIRIIVLLAAVRFLVGIGSTFKLHQVWYALIVFGAVLLVLAVVLLFDEPGLPG
jgi:heme A synthase